MSGLFYQMRFMSLYPQLFLESIVETENENTLQIEGLAPHPLLTELILQNIFAYLTPHEVLKCRQVCKLWNTEVLIACRQKIPQKLVRSEASLKKLNAVFKHTDTFPVSNFHLHIKDMRKPQYDFFQSTAVRKIIVSLKVTVVSHLLPAVLASLGNLSSLKFLTITRIPEDSIDSVFVTRDSNFGITELNGFSYKSKLQKLESVMFENSVPSKKLLCSYTHIINSFLRCVPNLKILQFRYWRTPFPQVFCNFQFGKLEQLTVRGRSLGHDEVTYLISKKPKSLQSLEITVSPTVSSKLVVELLETVKGSLKTHKITHKISKC